MENKYIYKTKFVKTPEQYIAAVNKGYCVIEYPKEIKKSLLAALRKVKKNSLDLQYSYLQVKGDNENAKMKKPSIFNELLKLAELGNLKAINCAGVIYDDGSKRYEDDGKAILALKQAANAGFALAKYNLGLFYMRPENAAYYNLDHSEEYLREAADMGLASAQYTYAYIIRNNYDVMMHYLKLAAKQKYVKAYVKLGDVCHNFYEGIYWYKKAIKAGNTDVYLALASSYELIKDTKKALYYYKKGMRLGQYKCAERLLLYYDSLISKKVFKEAIELVKKVNKERNAFENKDDITSGKWFKIVEKDIDPNNEYDIRDDYDEDYDGDDLDDDEDEDVEGAGFYYERPETVRKDDIEFRQKEEDEGSKFAIKVLERAFNLMEEIILKCYEENDEKATRENIKKYLDDFESKVNNKEDFCVMKDARAKLDALSYQEMAEIYEILIWNEKNINKAVK